MADLEKIVEDLSSLTLLEAAELTKMLEEKWGISAAAPMAMGMTTIRNIYWGPPMILRTAC